MGRAVGRPMGRISYGMSHGTHFLRDVSWDAFPTGCLMGRAVGRPTGYTMD